MQYAETIRVQLIYVVDQLLREIEEIRDLEDYQIRSTEVGNELLVDAQQLRGRLDSQLDPESMAMLDGLVGALMRRAMTHRVRVRNTLRCIK